MPPAMTTAEVRVIVFLAAILIALVVALLISSASSTP
jgi:hypothetical protein